MKRLLALLFFILLAGAGTAGYLLSRPYQGYTGEAFVEISRGTGTQAMASQLADAGVIRTPWLFQLARLVRRNATLQAGEYRFDRPASTWEVFDKIVRGDVFTYEVVVPEGSNRFDIAETLGRQGIISREKFLQASADASLVRDLAPQAPSLEGFLYPAAYRYTRNTTARQLCREMTQRFRRAWQELGAPADNVGNAVTLASLVEKESAVPAERPVVASVYQNRLRIGMKLDCDPTTIYAAMLRNRYRGTLYRSDLLSDHPYNTYYHAGLPPGPIANPGIASLRAALRPADTGYLYFVAAADGSGGHRFASTLGEHNRNVQEYRRAQPVAQN